MKNGITCWLAACGLGMSGCGTLAMFQREMIHGSQKSRAPSAVHAPLGYRDAYVDGERELDDGMAYRDAYSEDDAAEPAPQLAAVASTRRP